MSFLIVPTYLCANFNSEILASNACLLHTRQRCWSELQSTSWLYSGADGAVCQDVLLYHQPDNSFHLTQVTGVFIKLILLLFVVVPFILLLSVSNASFHHHGLSSSSLHHIDTLLCAADGRAYLLAMYKTSHRLSSICARECVLWYV